MKNREYYFNSSKVMVDTVKEVKKNICLQLVDLDTSANDFNPCNAGMMSLSMCDVTLKAIADYDAVAQNTATKISNIKANLKIIKKLADMSRQ